MKTLETIDLAMLDNVTGGATEAELRKNLAGCYQSAEQSGVGVSYKQGLCDQEFVRQNFRNFTPTPDHAVRRPL